MAVSQGQMHPRIRLPRRNARNQGRSRGLKRRTAGHDAGGRDSPGIDTLQNALGNSLEMAEIVSIDDQSAQVVHAGRLARLGGSVNRPAARPGLTGES
ncbi:hypothetical protein JCM14635_29980 [Megalodesulfovibrio paquesii]